MSEVVVTGASGGIGSACVAALQARGDRVFGIDAAAESSADDHLAIDLSSPDVGDEVAAWVGDHSVALLVNNAAHVNYVSALETSSDQWDRTLSVNLRAPFLLAKALHTNLHSASGSVVNIASVHATATSSSVAAYAASKGGLVSLTRALALEWAPMVRVNAVLPGAVETAMLSEGLGRSGDSVEKLGSRHPLGRVGCPDEIAEAVIFLADSEFITGASLIVDGGATARLSTE